jgi:drug/metabolite transporter (DMT)-like permease
MHIPTEQGVGGNAALVVAGAASLSLSATFVKLADVTSGTAAFLRCLIALAALIPMALWELHRRGAMPSQLYPMAIVAGVFLGADYVMWTASILDVGASIATVLINVQVVVLPLIALVIDRTRIPRRFLMAMPCMLLGVALAGGLIGGGSGGDNALRGSILGIVAGAAYAAYLFLNRRSSQRSPTHIVTPICVATASAAVTAGIVSAGLGDLDLNITGAAWGWMVALALLGQVAAWLFISSGSRSLAANTVAALLLLQPVLAIAFGFIVLSERPTWLQLIGAAVVVGAVWTATRHSHPDSTSSHGRGLHDPISAEHRSSRLTHR